MIAKIRGLKESIEELLTPEGKYNYVAYLLANENGVSIKVAKYAGADKVEFPFSLPQNTDIIVNGDENGNENGETDEYKSKKSKSSNKRVER